jgi:hypothetical protein
MTSLSGTVCIVTGATSGIGAATAAALARDGARVVVAGRRAERLEQVARAIESAGGRCVAVRCDVTDRAQVKALVERARTELGRIDVLVNNAGIMPIAPMMKCRIDDWDAMIDVNLKGLLYAIGFTLPVMLAQRTGHIVNVSSVAGRKLFPAGAVYCATKHAVHAVSEGLREELAEQSKRDGTAIRVTIVAPGVVRTELPETITDDEARESFKGYVQAMRDPLESADVADAIVWAVAAPAHVNVNEVLVRPVAQVR